MEGALLMTVLPYSGVPIFNEDGTFRKEDDVVQGRSYSSNLTKLLKQLPKLENLQKGKPPSPVMAHISLTNYCNLTCSFCCFAKSANPGDPDSSPVSIKIFELKPRQPLVSSMLFSAPIFTVCWPLLSAVPRP